MTPLDRSAEFVDKSKFFNLKITDVGSSGGGLAFLMRTDPEGKGKWRLLFQYQDPQVNPKHIISLCWYVGAKHYSARLPFQQYLDMSLFDLHEIVRRVVLANEEHDELTKKLKQLPVDVKEFIKFKIRKED